MVMASGILLSVMAPMDFRLVAAEWLRALRGPRSRVAFSRRLRYRSNIAYRWEAGCAFPTASGTFELIEKLGGDVRKSLERFYRSTPPWLNEVDACSSSGVARLLDDLRGATKVIELARRTGYSRFAITRWLRARADPTLPEFLTLIELTSRRALDFIASFTDREAWKLLRSAREAAYDQPWSHAVLRALELVDYSALQRHEPGWVARRLGISEELERASLEVLERSGRSGC